jgi:Rrf2 family protein
VGGSHLSYDEWKSVTVSISEEIDMQITHQADYAIRAMLYLATADPEERIATSQIAEAYAIPASFLTKIVSQLSIAGLIRTSRGARGGISLSKPSEEISVLDVLEAIEGPVTMNECVNDPGCCEFSAECKIHRFWNDTCTDFVARLRETNFHDLAAKAHRPEMN